MTVKIVSGKYKLIVPCSMTAALIVGKNVLKKEGIDLPVLPLLRQIKKAKQLHPNWTFAEVETADGKHITVKL